MQSALSHTSRQALGGHTLSTGRVGASPVQRQVLVVTRAASSDKLLKRPEARPQQLQQKPDMPQQPEEPAAAAAAAPAAAAAAPAAAAAAAPSSSDGSGVTIEWQRQRAKEMRKYFQDSQLEAVAEKKQVFGWTPANEIGNGRWVMFGVFVGLLTEYATGVDFPNQIRLMLTYLGIVDVE